MEHIVSQKHQLPDKSLIRSAQQVVKSERAEELKDTAERIRESAPPKTKRVLDMATEKGSLMWLTVLPLQEMGFNLNNREFRDAIKLRYDWHIDDSPSMCVCGEVCGFVIQRHNELRDPEATTYGM